jgi:hypothetical protein
LDCSLRFWQCVIIIIIFCAFFAFHSQYICLYWFFHSFICWSLHAPCGPKIGKNKKSWFLIHYNNTLSESQWTVQNLNQRNKKKIFFECPINVVVWLYWFFHSFICWSLHAPCGPKIGKNKKSWFLILLHCCIRISKKSCLSL